MQSRKVVYPLLYPLVAIIAVIVCGVLLDLFCGGHLFEGNIYNSYSLQAASWLDGGFDLGRDYSHLELAYFGGKVFVSFPPFPSVIMLPFVALFGVNTPDNFLALIVCAVSVYYAYKLCLQIGVSERSALFLSLFACVGSNYLFLMINGGWVWFFAQLLSFLFTVMSFYYAGKGSFFLAPLMLACAVGCRPFQMIYAPVTAFLLYRECNKNGVGTAAFTGKLALGVVPAALLCLFYALLNYLRFGSPLEFGHNYLPEFQEAVNGQFHISYLKDNLLNLLKMPYFDENGNIIFHKFDGTAFWLVSPIFVTFLSLSIVRVFGRQKCINRETRSSGSSAVLHIMLPLLIATHLLMICLHKTMGGWHFGNRYTIDAIPAVLLGAANLWGGRKRGEGIVLVSLNMPLLIVGLLINAAGTVWIYTA